MRFIEAKTQKKRLTETFLPFLHLLSRFSSRSTTMQPGAAWSRKQLSAGRLGSGFVREGTIQHGDQRGMKRKGKHRPTKRRRRSYNELFAAVGRHTACESTFIADRSCMYDESQAANDRTTKRCFSSAAQRPSNPTGHLIAADPAARCFANQRFDVPPGTAHTATVGFPNITTLT